MTTRLRRPTRRKWVTMYACRVGPLANVAMFTVFAGESFITSLFEDGRRDSWDDPLGVVVAALILSSVIAAAVALAFAHLLASIGPLANRPRLLKRVFQATAVASIIVPLGLQMWPEPRLMLLILTVAIAWICRIVERRLPPYPPPPKNRKKTSSSDQADTPLIRHH